MDDAAQIREATKSKCREFFDQDHGHGQYAEKIKALITKDNISRNRLRLDVDLQDLHDFSDELYRRLLADPTEVLGPLEDVLDEVVRDKFPKMLQADQKARVGLVGEFGAHSLSPRQLGAQFLNQLVKVGCQLPSSLARAAMSLLRVGRYCFSGSMMQHRSLDWSFCFPGLMMQCHS